jgi:hypothetical protein
MAKTRIARCLKVLSVKLAQISQAPENNRNRIKKNFLQRFTVTGLAGFFCYRATNFSDNEMAEDQPVEKI